MQVLRTVPATRDIYPYEEFANAIIIQAADDYRRALKLLKKNSDNKQAGAERKKYGLFPLRLFHMLTCIDPEVLLHIRRGVNNDCKRYLSTGFLP